MQVAVRTPMPLQGLSCEAVCGVGVASCQSQLRLLPQVRGDKWAVGAVKPLVNRKRLIGQRSRTLDDAKLTINAGQHGEKLPLHCRLRRQVTLHATGAFIENLPQGDFAAGGQHRIGPLKDADQERRDRLGLLRLERLRPRLPGGRCQPAQQREHQRHGDRDADAMPPHEFAGAISASLRPRGHRPPLEKSIQVVGQRACSDVAVLWFPTQCFDHDRIEVARQPRGERARGETPCVGDLVNRFGVIVIPEDGHVRRPWRFGLGRRAVASAAGRCEGPPRGQQLEEDQAERVDVRGGGHALTAQLLGRRISRRQPALTRARQLGWLARVVIGEQLGDAEVEQLQIAGRRDEDVRGLQIAVDDEPAIRVLHGIAHPAEQPHPRVDREAPGVAVGRDRLAFHELHREVRPAVGVEATIEETGDGRVIELGENLPFATEADGGVVAVEAASHELERDDLNEFAIGALGAIHDAHASAAELLDHAIRTDASPDVERTLVGVASRRQRPAAQPGIGAIIQEVACGRVCGEQLLDSLAESGVVAADPVEQGGSPIHRQLQRLIEQRFEARPVGFGRWAAHFVACPGTIMRTRTKGTERCDR